MLTDAPERIWIDPIALGCSWVTDDDAEPDRGDVAYVPADLLTAAEAERDAALARVERLRGAAEYILDGMGIDGPDYTIPPDDDLLDASNGPWVRDTLTRLAAALAEDAKP